MLKDELLEKCKAALDEVIERYRPRFAEARNLEQLALVYREYQEEKFWVLQPFIEAAYLIPPDPIIIANPDA